MKAFRRHRWSRLGAALGVLAVLALAVLAPIHHVHGIQRDFGTLRHAGHAGDGAGTATAAGHHRHHQAPADEPAKPPIQCPVCMLGKMAGPLLQPPGLPALAVPIAGAAAPAPDATAALLPGRSEATGQPRAPPVRA